MTARFGFDQDGMARPTLKKDFAWTFVGNVTYAATQWAVLAMLARLGSKAAVGQFSLGLAITSPIMLFSGLQLRSVQATDSKCAHSFGDYAGLRLLTTGLGLVAVLALSRAAYRGEVALVVSACGLSKAIESLSDIIYGLWQRRERMDLIARSLILRGVLALLLGAVGFAGLKTVWAAVLGIVTAWAGSLLLHDLRFARQVAMENGESIVPNFSRGVLKELFRIALPLGVVIMLLSFISYVPQYVLSHLHGLESLGVFAAVGYVMLSGSFIVNALGQAATPRLAAYFSGGQRRDFERLSKRLMGVGAAIGVSGVLASLVAGRQILSMLYGQEYGRYGGLLAWMMVAAGFGYMASFAGYGLTAARHFKAQMPLFGLVALLDLGLCLVLGRIEGAIGVAQAMCLANAAQLAAAWWLLRINVRRLDERGLKEAGRTPCGARPRPLRVLHVLGALNRGGVERWLLELSRRIDRRSVQFDFAVHDPLPGVFEPEIRGLGCHVLRCRAPHVPPVHSGQLLRALLRQGPYDVVHSHIHFYSGLVLSVARAAGVPGRIAHSHVAHSPDVVHLSPVRRIYSVSARELIRRFASSGIAVSSDAASELFGPSWRSDPRWEVLPCAIDLSCFCNGDHGALRIRRELGIRDDAFVVGHVGRFDLQKNHDFILEVALHLMDRRPEAVVLFVGDGTLRHGIESKAARMRLRNVCFAGGRDNVPALLGTMDAFIFPSLYEGVSLALLEAQAAGLDCIVARHLGTEQIAVPQLVRRLPLHIPTWVDTVCAMKSAPAQRASKRKVALRCLNRSPFNIDRCLEFLLQHYERTLEGGVGRGLNPTP